MIRNKAQLGVLIALLGLVVAVTIVSRWRAVNAVDNRTYVEMVAGVRDHGLPYHTSSIADLVPPSEFNIADHEKLWGEYPPLFPFIAAPALALGGLSFIYREVVLTIGVVAALSWLLARRLTNQSWAGPLAATVTLLGTPLYAGSFQTFAMPLTIALVIGAVLFAIRAHEAAKPFDLVATGFMGGLAVSAHLLAMPMMAALFAALAVLETRAVPLALAARRAALVCAGFLGPALAMALLNHHRFATFNPISYGPCRWRMCTVVLDNSLSQTGLLWFMMPLLPYGIVLAVGAWLARKSPWRWGLLLLVMGALLIIPWFRFSAGAMLVNVWAYIVDPSWVKLDPLERLPDGLGLFRSGNCVKGFLQSCPFAICALAARPGWTGVAARRALAWSCALGLVIPLAALARFGGASALGWPYLFSRYVLYAAPVVVALAAAGAVDIGLRRVHVAVVLVIAAALTAYFVSQRFDFDFARRVLMLRVTLLVALATCIVSFWHRAPKKTLPWLVAASIALSIGVSTGVDSHVSIINAGVYDQRLEALEHAAPSRVGLIGFGGDMDSMLALGAERDIEYVDLGELDHRWDKLPMVMDGWKRDGRAILAVKPRERDRDWPPGIAMDLVDEQNAIYAVR